MKTPKDYYISYVYGELSNLPLDKFIKQIQIDTIRETVQTCADNADADYTFTGNRDENSDIEVYVIKSSILEVADKLIKEL